MFCDSLTMSDRGGSLHRLYHDLKLQAGHTQLLLWFWDQRTWTMHLTSNIVAQGQQYMFGYVIPLFYERYTRHGIHMSVVDHPIDHWMTSTPPFRRAQLLHCFSHRRDWIMYLTSVVVVHGQWHSNVHAMLLFYKCYMRHIPCLTGVGNPVYH